MMSTEKAFLMPRKPCDPRPRRLVVLQSTWEAALRRLLRDASAIAVGSLRIHNTPQSRELLVDRLEVTTAPPQGRDYPPPTDWCLVTYGPCEPPEVIQQRFAPLPQQLLCVLQVDRHHRGQWRADLWHAEGYEPITEWHLPGRLGLRLVHGAVPVTPSHEETRRDSRLAPVLTEAVSQRARQATVTFIGSGRIAALAAFQIGGLGSHMRLIDDDVLLPENLNAMPGVSAADTGLSKVRALARGLRRFRPDLHLTLLERPVQHPDAARWLEERSDLMVTGVDDELARVATNIIANRTLTTQLHIATSIQRIDGHLRMTGDARLFLPHQGCCVCVGGIPDVDDVYLDLIAPPHRLPRRVRPAWHQVRLGSLATLNAMTVGCAVQLWLDLLMGRISTSFWQRLEWTPEHGLVANGGPVTGDEACRWCGREVF